MDLVTITTNCVELYSKSKVCVCAHAGPQNQALARPSVVGMALGQLFKVRVEDNGGGFCRQARNPR